MDGSRQGGGSQRVYSSDGLWSNARWIGARVAEIPLKGPREKYPRQRQGAGQLLRCEISVRLTAALGLGCVKTCQRQGIV
jgi:hypothetical protein